MNINIIQQFKYYWKQVLILVIFLNLFFLLAFGISSWFSLPIVDLLEDPASLYGYNQFAGFVTLVSTLILACGIGAVIIMALLNASLTYNKREFISFIIIALISLFLALDDLFLLHERVFTGLFQVGERSIYLFYLLCLAGFLLIFRKEILASSSLLIIIALLMFGQSILLDILSDKINFSDVLMESMEFLEEYSKFGGYLFWTAFIMQRTKMMIQTGNEG